MVHTTFTYLQWLIFWSSGFWKKNRQLCVFSTEKDEASLSFNSSYSGATNLRRLVDYCQKQIPLTNIQSPPGHHKCSIGDFAPS